ncbi:MAG: hypothetical protein SV377_02765 [Halobacteria archaeon]|nr:hypothetical protein [Halobacteria archaeon]
MSVSSIVERVKQPQYTGENRCIPCTAVNVVISAILAGALAFLLNIAVGVVLFVLFALTIYLRGYLIPGTPTLTKRYFPDRVLKLFDKHEPAVELTGEDDAWDEEAVEEFLYTINVVEECEDEDDLCLTPDFEREWEERIKQLRSDEIQRDYLAELVDADSSQLSFDTYGEAFVASLNGQRVGQWESKAAFLADIAAEREISKRHRGWEDVSIQKKSRVLSGLRIFIEKCPSCDGPVTVEQDTVESCCRSIDVLAATCNECSSRLFEVEYSAMAQ